MKSVIASLVAVAGLSVAASAATTVQMLVSSDGGATFGSAVNVLPGSTVEVLVAVSNTGTSAIGLGSFQFQPTVSNWSTATDSLAAWTSSFGANTTTPSGAVADAPGQYGRISPWAAINANSSARLFGHTNHAGFLRIAQAFVTNWIGEGATNNNVTGGSGVNIRQNNAQQAGRSASEPAFNPSLLNIHVLRFAVTVGGDARTLVVDAPIEGFGNLNATTGAREVYWYSNPFETSGSIREVAQVIPGLINVVPTPASLALLGLGGLCVARRRR